MSEIDMASILVERELLLDLVDSKLHLIRSDMEQILQKWGYKSVEKFIQDARSGTLEEAEEDAICIRGLIYDQDKIVALKKGWVAQ